MTINADLDSFKAQQESKLQRAFGQWSDDVANRVIVITGAARGIGMTMAVGLLKAGAKVVVTDKTFEGSDEFRKTLDNSDNGMAIEMDVTNNDAIDSAYEAVIERFGTTDVLINNAALVSETRFTPLGHVKTLDTTDKDWEVMFDVNVFGTVKSIRRFIKPMIEKQSGCIVNMVSSGILTTSTGGGYLGLRPWTVEMPYQATKAALMALTFYLGDEVRPDGIAVNAMMPGHTRASWFDATARAYSNQEGVYGTRPVVADHILPITLFLSAQDGGGVAGRMYNVPEWNYDHGFGNYALWLDRWLPEDMEEEYQRAEAQMPRTPIRQVRRPE